LSEGIISLLPSDKAGGNALYPSHLCPSVRALPILLPIRARARRIGTRFGNFGAPFFADSLADSFSSRGIGNAFGNTIGNVKLLLYKTFPPHLPILLCFLLARPRA
jgi:hypothetical protein